MTGENKDSALYYWDHYSNAMKIYKAVKGNDLKDLQHQKLLLEIMLGNLLSFIEVMFRDQDPDPINSEMLSRDMDLEKLA